MLEADQNALDPDFLSFLESLSAPVVKPDVTTLRKYPCPPPHSRLLIPLDPTAPTEPYDKHQSTPLLEFLKEQRTAKRGADAGKDAPRTRREREREKLDKKRGAGGDKSSGNGKQQQARLTAPSVAASVVPGQVKIAKRPAVGAGEELSRDARGQKKAGAVSDAGKRGEGKAQMNAGSGQGHAVAAASAGPGGKGKSPGARGNGGNGKPPKGDVAGKQVEKPRPAGGNRSMTPQPSNAGTTAPTQTKQRPPRGPANLLAAALKSTTRDHPARSDESKPARSDESKPACNRPAKANGPSEAALQGTTGEASPAEAGAGEKGKRPPRNRGRKAGGDAAQGRAGDSPAAAHVARIDA